MKSYRHQIAKSKLEKMGLNESQIARVYMFKSKAKQTAKAKQIAGANKGNRKQKFYRTALGRYVLKKQINRLIEKQHSDYYKNLSEKQQQKFLKKIDKLKVQWEMSQYRATKTKQAKEDLLFKLEKLRARINAGEYTYTQRTTNESYDYNGTLNKTTVEYITSHYPDELDKLLKGEQDKDGNWIKEPMSFQDAVDELFDEAIRNGDIEELAQGAGFGYIDQDNKEIISPI